MPLVRFGVKNEYNLGVKELYKDGVLNEDPKAVLDGVAVAGLVGVLRQLGDLAQFAAEVFHGLQEQVASTSSRSRKLVNRVQRVEASLPSIEKAILSQTDHLRFAYTPGSEVHACIRIERNHFIYDDLPHFVMDSYEECKEPPRLQLLDRFDSSGPGSCLKRYSDPTFFKRASYSSEASKSEKSQRERKARKIKKRRSWQRSEQFPKSAPTLNGSGRIQSSTGQGQSSLSQTGSNFDTTFNSDLGQSDSRGSKEGVSLTESVSHPKISSTQAEIKNKGLSSSVPEAESQPNGSIYLGEQTATFINDKPFSHAAEATPPHSSNATWDERLELYEPGVKYVTEDATPPRSSNATWDERLELYDPGVKYVTEDIRQMPVTNLSLHGLTLKLVNAKGVSQINDLCESGSSPKSTADEWHLKTSDGNVMEPTRLSCESNEVQDYLKTNFGLQEHYLEPPHPNSCSQMMDCSEDGKPPEPTTVDNSIHYPTYSKFERGEVQYLLEANIDDAEKEWETIDSEDFSPVNGFTEDGSNVKSIEWEQQESEIANAEHVSRVDEFCGGANNENVLEWKEQDLETLNLEHVSQENAFSEGGNTVNVIEWNQPELERYAAGHEIEMGISSEVGNGMKLIKWNMPELESQIDKDVSQVDTFTEGGDAVQVIEWNEQDDVDSGTDNFVDALYTIESESESDFETEMKKEVVKTTSKDEVGENTTNGHHMAELSSQIEPEHQSIPTSYVCEEERNLEDLERSTSPVSSENVLSPENPLSSHPRSESATGQRLDVSTCMADEQSVETRQSATLSDDTQGLDTCSNNPVTRVEPAVPEIARSGSEAPGGEKIISAPHVSQETSVSSSTTYPVMSVEPAVSDISSSGSAAPGNEKITCAPHVSQETSVGSSTTHPVGLWTNGTLFGLAPSKPVVCSKPPNSVESAPTRSTFSQSNHDAMQTKDDATGILASSLKESEHGNKSDYYGQYVGSSNEVSQKRLDTTHDTSVAHDKSNSSDHPVIRDLINGDAMVFESKVLVRNHVKNVSSDASSASEDKSSLLSVFSRGLLKNGLRRSGSLGCDERYESSSPSKSNGFDDRCADAVSHPVPETNVVGKLDSSVNSPPSSPPLEHMKISFQPIDGFDASRLKLKYPEGIDQYENTLDAFPSFQLVPESTKLQRDIASDSDNDTFCRSYAYMSDESPSHQSDSDSEQWESGDSTESNDHTLYNGLHRISSADSASTSPQHEETYHANVHDGSRSVSNSHALSDSSFHLPILDAKNPFAHQEMKLSLNPAVDCSHEPPPLPLPPLQWRVSRPLFDEVENNQHQRLDSVSQSSAPKLSDSLITHPTKVDSAKLIDTVQESATIAKPKESATVIRPKESATVANPKESTTIAKPRESATIPKPKKEVEEQRLGQERAFYAEKERKMDGGGDFLQQIRTKSFNLKRTEPTRPIYAPTPATSNKITAILQKASAIRQAVGSDDGEDDSWSDT